jgi:hypothetical protein
LPGFLDDEGYGAHLGGIVSQRWDWGTINWNLQGEYTRNHHADAFASAIVEGPDKWKVRPVSEFFYEEKIGVARTLSALVGAICCVSGAIAHRHQTRDRPHNAKRSQSKTTTRRTLMRPAWRNSLPTMAA